MANPNPAGAPRFRPNPRANGERQRGGRRSLKVSPALHRRLQLWSLASGVPMRELADRAVLELLDREQRRALRSGRLPWEQ